MRGHISWHFLTVDNRDVFNPVRTLSFPVIRLRHFQFLFVFIRTAPSFFVHILGQGPMQIIPLSLKTLQMEQHNTFRHTLPGECVLVCIQLVSFGLRVSLFLSPDVWLCPAFLDLRWKWTNWEKKRKKVWRQIRLPFLFQRIRCTPLPPPTDLAGNK